MGKVRDKELPDFVKPFASSWSQAFLKFCLADDAATCVIPATSKPEHVADNVVALEKLAARTGRCAAIVGFVDARRDLYNAAAVCAFGSIQGVYRKRLRNVRQAIERVLDRLTADPEDS